MLVIFYFFIILIFFLKIRKENSIRRWVFGLYTFSAFWSVLYPLVLPVNYQQDVIAYVYYTICTLIILYPIWRFGKVSCLDFTYPEKFIIYSSYVLIVFGILGLINVLPQIFSLRTYINNVSDVRTAYYRGDALAETSTSFVFVLANWVSYIQFFSPIFAWLNFFKGKKIVAVLLCFVSFLPAFNGLIIGEREASVVVLSNFIFSFIFFRPILSDKFISAVKKIGLLLTSPFVVFIIAMTFSRFDDSDGGILGGLLVYIGEQPYNFSYFFSHINIEQQHLGGRLSFSYMFPESQRLEGQINDYINAGEYLNVFAAIPGSILLDFAYSAIIVILLISLFFLSVFSSKRNRKTNKYNFSVFMALLIYYQIVFMGIFYFDFTSKYVVFMCILMFIAYFIVTNVMNYRKSII